MSVTLPQPYEDLAFMTPLSEHRADKLLRFVAEDLRGTVLDIGCGWAEFLLRVLAAAPKAEGIGVDLHRESIERARQLADQRALGDRVTLTCGDGRVVAPNRADAVVCIGASQIWSPPVTENQPLDYASALAALRRKVSRGARVIYGEAIWSRPPTAEAIAPLAGRIDELVSIEELANIAAAQGFVPISIAEATVDEWDEFESKYAARYSRWLVTHPPDHPDAPEVRRMAERQRSAYLGGYRGVMGMAYLSLLAL